MEMSNQKEIDIPFLWPGSKKKPAKAPNSLSTIKCLQDLKRNSTDKEHLHTHKDFLREQVQINTGATEGVKQQTRSADKGEKKLKRYNLR